MFHYTILHCIATLPHCLYATFNTFYYTIPCSTTLHCTTLLNCHTVCTPHSIHCTTILCSTALHCTTLLHCHTVCTPHSIHCTTLYRVPLHYTALHGYTATPSACHIQYILLHYIVCYYTALHYTALRRLHGFTVYTLLHSTTLHNVVDYKHTHTANDSVVDSTTQHAKQYSTCKRLSKNKKKLYIKNGFNIYFSHLWGECYAGRSNVSSSSLH